MHAQKCRNLEGGHFEFDEYKMHLAHRYIGSLLFTAALAAPVAVMDVLVPQQATVQLRAYDKDNKDYHNWNSNKNRSRGQYLPPEA
jgi:hypothetical protein